MKNDKQLAQLKKDIANITKKLAVDIIEDCASDTPVRSGYAQSQWQLTTGNGHQKEIRSVSDIVSEAKSVEFQLGQPLHIINETPYISILNDGSESHSPIYFIEKSIDSNTKT
jgi:hypothetical protein